MASKLAGHLRPRAHAHDTYRYCRSSHHILYHNRGWGWRPACLVGYAWEIAILMSLAYCLLGRDSM